MTPPFFPPSERIEFSATEESDMKMGCGDIAAEMSRHKAHRQEIRDGAADVGAVGDALSHVVLPLWIALDSEEARRNYRISRLNARMEHLEWIARRRGCEGFGGA